MAIPVTLITGFLGSGKTTLLNRLLASPQLGAAAVVVNEIGEVSIDHDLVRDCRGNVVTLANGCICCSVRGELADTLMGLLVERSARTVPIFDRVLIETTGIASPARIIDLIATSPILAERFQIDRVVTTVDALEAEATLREFDEATEQVAVADVLVLTKLDLAHQGDEARDRLTSFLQALNRSASVVASGEAALALFPADTKEAGPAIDLLARLKTVDGRPRHADAPTATPHAGQHDHGIHITAIVEDTPIAYESLRLFLDAIAREHHRRLLRVKGLVDVAERPGRPAVINSARGMPHAIEWLPGWPSSDRRSRLVLITRGVEPPAIRDSWRLVQRFAARSAALAEG